MSWWDTGNSDDVIGDEPADILAGALRAIRDDSEKFGQPKPTIQELLNGVAKALDDMADTYTAGHSPMGRLVMKLRPDIEVVSAECFDARCKKIAELFCRALKEINDTYMNRWDRKPRLTELLEILLFVLSFKPERYLSVPPGTTIYKINKND